MSIGLPEEESPLDAPPSPGSAGILVVDEDPAFQLGLKTFLREYVGFEKVFTARSGREALDKIASEESIELITLDFQMPGMTGIEMLRELSASDHRPLSVIMITGYPSGELESQFFGFQSPTLLTNKFLAKPVEFEKLEPVVLQAHEELIALKRAAEEIPEDVHESEIHLPGHIADGTLEKAIERQSAKIAELEWQIHELRGKWRGDFVIVLVILFFLWLAAEFGAFEPFGEEWERAKSNITRSFESASPSESDGEISPQGEAPPVDAPDGSAEGSLAEPLAPPAPPEDPAESSPPDEESDALTPEAPAPAEGRPL